MHNNNIDNNVAGHLADSMVGLGKALEVIDSRQNEQEKLLKASIKANYQAGTKEGKKRYAAELVKEYGSKAKVATILGLSRARITQLTKSPKKNGK
ncbi:hypothetical protein MNB_SV-3-1144 [hydrothermal vent metagenome]|uniref:Resolvase HTH domain-containing protein n=1 Tax=hydrothermal vent metagenome TaxID=652676 RepID=A0A1W1CLN2_9ZZZZ